MKPNYRLILSLAVTALLTGCAGPSATPAPRPAAPVPKSPTPAAANLNAHRFYIVTFDAKGVPHDRAGVVVTRERVLHLLAIKDLDSHVGIRIEVPKGIIDRQKNIEAFSRAQQVARIFDLLAFEAVVVVLAEK